MIVTFDQGGNGYKLHNDADGDGVEDAGERIKIVNLDSRVQFGFFGTGVVDMDGNVVNNPVSLVSGGNTFTFNSRGEASTGGSIYLIHVSDAGEHNNLFAVSAWWKPPELWTSGNTARLRRRLGNDRTLGRFAMKKTMTLRSIAASPDSR